MTNRTYTICDRGDRWKLTLFDDGEEAGGGAFPYMVGDEEEKQAEYNAAIERGDEFMG